jgi:pimeloyl-ACP methyl ester carboxylesterase
MTLTLSNTSSSSSVADTGHREAYPNTAALHPRAGTLASPVGRRLLLVSALAAALLAPAQARAAIPLATCGVTGVVCGTVVVPLDRSGRTPGSIPLHVEVLPATRPVGVMFLIAGGPGQGSAASFDLVSAGNAQFYQAIFPGYTLAAFDNRGTGKSGLIDCPALQRAVGVTVEEERTLTRDCANEIGLTRQFYATRDHAEDIESVRTALGFGRIGLYGVSYGTKLALAYALAHPSGVDRLVLDSVVPPSYPDPFDSPVLTQMPAALNAFCAGGRCRGATANFAGEVATLANRLEAKPAQGVVIVAGGARHTVKLNGEDLVGLIIDSDLSPGLAAELPAAVHGALAGYVRPLLRLFDIDERTSTLASSDLSFGLNVATNCADGRFPWSPDTPVDARASAWNEAVAAQPAGSFGPFGTWAARMGTASLCLDWPSPAGNTPLGPGPFPNVPVLIVNGGYDLRTPVANAVAVARQFPQSHLIVVPGVGHSVLTADFSFCAAQAVRQWIQGASLPASAECPRTPALVKTLTAFPRTSARTTRMTLAVAVKTVREAEATWLQALFASSPITPVGLYGGKLASSSAGDGFTLTGYSVAPGISISGRIKAKIDAPIMFTGTVQVSGPRAVAGTLRITRTTVSGTLGGRRVSAAA